jgi:hypothetical protein
VFCSKAAALLAAASTRDQSDSLEARRRETEALECFVERDRRPHIRRHNVFPVRLRAGFGSRVLFRVSTCPFPIPVDDRESDRVGLGLSRLALFALLAILAVNRVDERQFGAANPPRHGCVHFQFSFWCVNKQKEPSRAAAPIGVANILGFSCRQAASGGDEWATRFGRKCGA